MAGQAIAQGTREVSQREDVEIDLGSCTIVIRWVVRDGFTALMTLCSQPRTCQLGT